MTSVAQAIADVGTDLRDGEDVVLTVITADGQVVNHTLDEIGDEDVGTFPALYQASGTFRSGTVTSFEGRKRGNVARALWVVLDCDLLDWLQVPRDDKAALARARADLWGSDDATLEAMLVAQRADIERVMDLIAFPIHRLDVTGYGHCAYVRIADDDQHRVDDAVDAAKLVIAGINQLAGYTLADAQASDPGTRITRVPGSYNCKGDIPRIVRTIYQRPGSMPLGANPKQSPSTAESVVIPDVGRGLDQAGCDAIVRALAPLWGPGARNGIAFGLGGMMAKVRVPESQAVAIVTALADGDPEIQDRTGAVRRSYARARSGKETAGFTWLRSILTDDALATVDRVLETLRPKVVLKNAAQRTAAGSDAPEEDATRDSLIAASFPPCPDAAYFGWFGRYRDLMAPTTEAPDAFHLAASLVLAGALIGRRVRTAYASDALYANLYAVLIGASGSSRKDTAIKRAVGVPFEPAGATRLTYAPFAMFRDVSSGEGLVSTLKDSPNTLLYLTEISTMMANARRKGSATILDRLIEAWDTPAKLENLSKLSPVSVSEPYLSIAAATQPTRLARNITDEDIHSGFANRWLYVMGAGKPAMARPPAVDKKAAYRLYLDFMDAIAHYPPDGASVLPWDGSADAAWDTWYLDLVGASGINEDDDAMRVRHPTLAQKIALIYAVSEKADAIGQAHVSAAIALVDWTWSIVRELLKEWGTGVNQVIESRVMGAVERNGPMSRRDIQRATSNKRWGAREFAQVFEAMVRNGALAQDDQGRFGIPANGA